MAPIRDLQMSAENPLEDLTGKDSRNIEPVLSSKTSMTKQARQD